jgi:hypothetical protein
MSNVGACVIEQAWKNHVAVRKSRVKLRTSMRGKVIQGSGVN